MIRTHVICCPVFCMQWMLLSLILKKSQDLILPPDWLSCDLKVALVKIYFLFSGNVASTRPETSAANRSIGEVVQSRKRPLLWPSPGWKRLLPLSHLRHYAKKALTLRCNYHEGRAAIRHMLTNLPVPYDLCVADPISHWETMGSTPV